jgi:tetratricopeptide (TPR) repeat protein
MINRFRALIALKQAGSMFYFACLIFAIAAATTQASDARTQAEALKALQTAERLQSEDKVQEALSAYEEILKKYADVLEPKDVMLKMASCYSQLGDDDSAVRIYLKLISEDPNSISASQAVSFMINLYSRRYQFDEVIAMSRHLAKQYPGTEVAAMAMYRAAGNLYSQGKFQEAIQEYEKFVSQFPGSVMRSTAFSRLISLYISQSMFEEAERKLTDRLAEAPKDTYMLRQLALVYQKQGEYGKALDLYQKILSANPGDISVYEQLGELYIEKGDRERALAEWYKITESAPRQYSRHQMLAYILKTHNFHDQAVEEYRKAIALQPLFSYLYKQLADLYIIKKQFGSAVDTYLDALTKLPVNLPDRTEITTSMLELCEMEGLYDRTISRLKADLVQSPDSLPILLTLADVYFHQRNFDDSLQQFKAIAALHPDRGEILFDRAQKLERERQFDQAIQFYQHILDLFPGSDISSDALMHIGQLRAYLHQPEAAIASLQILTSHIGNSPGTPWLSAYILIGDIYLEQMHDVHAALSVYRQAKAKVGNQSGISNALYADLDLKIAECYRLMAEYDKAENLLDSIQLRHRSRSITARVARLRGDCYFSRGDFDNALAQYKEAIQWLMNEDWVNDCLDKIAIIKEYSDSGLYALLQVHSQVERLRKIGRYDEALALCESVVKQYSPADRIQMEIGNLFTLQTRFMEAILAYEELVQSGSPLAPEAQFRIAEIHWQHLKDSGRAIEEYSALIEKYPESIMVAEARKRIRQLASDGILDTNIP